jgi:SAM-dependent methyltransferase
MNSNYWMRLHEAVEDDLAVVNYPALPASFNRMVDGIFAAAVMDAVRPLPPGRAVEIGCGRGRWLRRLRALGWRAFGMDVAEHARPDLLASASAPPLRPAGVDLVLAITVLQHLPEMQEEAVLGARRALRPGGHFLLVEVLDRPGIAWQAHMYPRSAKVWRETIAAAGLTMVAERPVEHLPIVRLIERFRRGTREASGSRAPGASSVGTSRLKRLAWESVVMASRPLEPIWRGLFPESASHRLFLARLDR